MQTVSKTKLEGRYKLEGDYLKSDTTTLKVGMRHRAKKGQAKRFIGLIDTSKPEPEQFNYLSSLYAKQGTKNTFQLESEGVYYTLKVAGVNEVVITEQVKEPALKFTDGNEWPKLEVDWNE